MPGAIGRNESEDAKADVDNGERGLMVRDRKPKRETVKHRQNSGSG